ncbi:jg24372 [Pararge aegeria aegeria]|uniref:Jg24372 protein n=1 Tax=Pararge aegeria aegeria TaxID=348720 RepID=A0A8S4RWP9_9NEOP|nr:jg24372 [Pararge aegeria aegeria]
MALSTCFLIFILFSAICKGDIDMDYYSSPVLRSSTSLTCNSHLSQYYCQIKCNMKPALCIQNDCYCITIAPANQKESDNKNERVPARKNNVKRENGILEFVDFEDFKPKGTQHVGTVSINAMRPTLRHHIAHFCPNADVARACIRKCMAEGKPAFCGKDHVCYCGHKYTHTGKDEGVNAKEMYAEFKDLYKKYFGPNYAKISVEV